MKANAVYSDLKSKAKELANKSSHYAVHVSGSRYIKNKLAERLIIDKDSLEADNYFGLLTAQEYDYENTVLEIIEKSIELYEII